MKKFVALLLLATAAAHGADVASTSAALKTHDVGYGIFQAPEDFELRHTGTADSFMGTLTRKSDNFTIHFDIGFGTRISWVNRDRFALFRVHTIGNSSAYTGIERGNGKQTVSTTICEWCERGRRLSDESKAIQQLPAEQRKEKYRDLNARYVRFNGERPSPANFWAEFTREDDLLEFMLIVNSYAPHVMSTAPGG